MWEVFHIVYVFDELGKIGVYRVINVTRMNIFTNYWTLWFKFIKHNVYNYVCVMCWWFGIQIMKRICI